MKPSILEGDRIFVNKLAYDLKIPFTTFHLARWADPKRGEVVIFYSPKDGTRLVKRVVGVPGDTVELRDDKLYVNGAQAEYQPLDSSVVNQVSPQEQANRLFALEQTAEAKHPVMISPNLPAMRSFGPLTLKADQYFMMGDNRDQSFDSRYFGPVDRRRIVGRALSVIASLDINHYFMPRWGRFFKALP
jgi:signal peptidase I